MDALVDLLPLLFIGAYYLLAGRRRAQRKQAARDPAPSAPLPESRVAEDQGSTPFQSFLEQLEEAMAEASGQPVAEAVPVQKPPPAPTPEFNAPVGSFDSDAPSDHEAHGFGPANPASEESFEKLPVFAETGSRSSETYDPHGLHTPAQARARSGWQRRLSDPKAAQDAFVLQTVFGARGGRRRQSR